MDWIRAIDPFAAARHEPHREPDVDTDATTPKFVLVDSKNRVRELTAAPPQPPSPATTAGAPSPLFAMPMSRPMVMTASHHNHNHTHRRRPFAENHTPSHPHDTAMDDDDAQLAQQLQYQREEMQFTRSQPLPRITPPPSHPFPSQHQQTTPTFGHAFTYTDSSTSSAFHPLSTPPSVPPVSPFAGMALSAPAKSSTSAKPPVNPFSTASAGLMATSIESSPRLPSLNAFRASSPRNLRLGIAARPPTATSSSSSTMPSPLLAPASNNTPLPSLSSSLPSPHHTLNAPYSQSLPGLSFLQDRLVRQHSVEGVASDSLTNSEEDEERDSALLMMRLSSSMPASSSMDAAGRSGRVCRYSDCNNIARSRGLCRTHGGGKRCSHPGCNKSAQANRKCIAHGGGTPCSYEDCEKTAQSRGLCKAHGGGARCKHPNCPKSSQSKGLCRGHGGGIKCKEEDCDKWVQKNGYCIKHGRERAMSQ